MAQKTRISEKTSEAGSSLPEEMNSEDIKKLKTTAIVRFGLLVPFLGVCFFATAGTFDYWEAWSYMALLLIPMFLFLRYLFRHDLGLLKRRMDFKEKESAQKWIILFSSLLIIPIFILPGFDQRYGWSNLHPLGVLLGQWIVLAGYLIVIRVFIANSYAARTVKVEKGQKVIDTGPYAYVRHPMYIGALMLYGFTPLALGSWVVNLFLPLLIVALVFRIINEEKVLERELPGYGDYKKKVRWRLMPYIW